MDSSRDSYNNRYQYTYKKSINEGVIPFDPKKIEKIKSRIPESLFPIIWRKVQDFLSGKNECFFLFLEDVNCSECGEINKNREALYLSEPSGQYYLCKTCCGRIWNYIQDSIF